MGKILIINGADFSSVSVAVNKDINPSQNRIDFVPTINGGYIGADGAQTTNARYNSMVINLIGGNTYEVHQQKTAATTSINNIRVFEYTGSSYTQIEVASGLVWNYTCPSDGKSYKLQVIYDLQRESTYPEKPYIIEYNQ